MMLSCIQESTMCLPSRSVYHKLSVGCYTQRPFVYYKPRFCSYHWERYDRSSARLFDQQKQKIVNLLHISNNQSYPLNRNLSLSPCKLSLKRINAWKKRFFEISQKMEDKLEEHAPTAKYYYDYLMNGFRLEWSNIKEYYRIKKKVNTDQTYLPTYREDMTVYSVTRDATKVAPLVPLFIVPMGFVIMCIPIYFFPRYVLPASFWSFQQRQRFLAQMHKERIHEYGVIVHHLNYHKTNNPDPLLRSVVDDICNTISKGDVPTNVQMLRFKPLCRRINGPFDGDDMVYILLKAFCHTIMISPYLPSFMLKYRLRTTARLVVNLDKKLLKENLLGRFSPQEAVSAALMRGLDSARLSHDANIYWLRNWVKLTNTCDEGDIWFILHAMVLTSINYNEIKYQRKVFG